MAPYLLWYPHPMAYYLTLLPSPPKKRKKNVSKNILISQPIPEISPQTLPHLSPPSNICLSLIITWLHPQATHIPHHTVTHYPNLVLIILHPPHLPPSLFLPFFPFSQLSYLSYHVPPSEGDDIGPLLWYGFLLKRWGWSSFGHGMRHERATRTYI